MDSDAGMYTLTQCITGSPVDHTSIHGSPKGGFTPTSYMPPAVPISWCGGGGGETHITTLGGDSHNAVCTEASIHVNAYDHMQQHHPHQHHDMHDENNTVLYQSDPYVNSYHHHQERVSSACHKIESYSMVGGSHHCGNTVEDMRHFNNNNNTCDYNKEVENQQNQPAVRKYPRRSITTRGRVSKSKQTVSPDKETVSPKKLSESSDEEHSDSNNISNYDNVMVWLNHQACGGTVKRKRRITKTQRVAANHRERKRMVHLNTAFECLRETIPSFPYEKKLSRIQTLKLAIDYIGFMTEILYGKESAPTHSYYSGSESPEMNRDLHYW